jgi:CO/xanthine dehydrogenase Mo-binding subunit
VIEAEYHSPRVAHARLEPMNATVSVTDDAVTVWAPTKSMQMTEVVLANVLKVAPEKITIKPHLPRRRVRSVPARRLRGPGRRCAPRLWGGRSS